MYLQCMCRVTTVILYICTCIYKISVSTAAGVLIFFDDVYFYVGIVTPIFVIALVPVIVFYIYSQKYYIKTSRELSRLESTSRSPIYALFSETLDGLTTIRAYKAEKRFKNKCLALLGKYFYSISFLPADSES